MRRFVLLVGGVLAAFCAVSQEAGESRRTVLMAERHAGTEIVLTRPDGTREIRFEFNDRGRGPKVEAQLRLDAAGLPISIETDGNDYLKSPVSERFTLRDGVASWKNSAERGERRIQAPAYYVPMHGYPEDQAVLARALLAAKDRKLALLPEGEAHIERTAELTVSADGRERRVILYSISGLGFTPGTIWLDEKQQYFASVSSWSSVILEGWESSVPQLLAKQNEMEAARTLAVAKKLTRKPERPLAFTNVKVFDAESGRTQAGRTVVVEGNRIAAVGAEGSVEVPANAERIAGRGRTLLPGLWDMHVHIGPDEGVLHIAAGVTSVRDLANDHDALTAIARKIDAGEEIGPRVIVKRGFMDGRGPFTGPTKVFVDTEEEARSAIELYARNGYEGIKVYSSIKPQLLPRIIELAHGAKLKVSGHVPAGMSARQFIEAGASELQHINFVFLNFFEDVEDTRTPQRFTAVAERAAGLDLKSARVRDFVTLLRERKAVVDPTVTIFVSMFTDRPGKVSDSYAAIAARLPPQVRRGLLDGGLPVPDGRDAVYRESAQALLRMVKLLYDNGVTIVPGTDDLAGFTLHRELELYVEAGIPAPEVLKLATLGAARVAGQAKDLGSVQAGKLADLVLVEGDPAQNIADIRRTRLVVKDGNVYDPAALYRSVGVLP